jgi:CDP-paratose 2-epimerase
MNQNGIKTNSIGSGKDDSGRQLKHPVLITGGAGFIGTNLADRLLTAGVPVIIYDNLSRPGVETNLDWLMSKYGKKVDVEIADIRDRVTLSRCVRRAARVYHFAAQVAVTTSLTDPVSDFEVNAQGTLYLLEALRSLGSGAPPLVFTSTNKVYGALDDVNLSVQGNRYLPSDPAIKAHGIGEQRSIDFHSPYGCSKGSADQYVLDYARTFDIPAAVFRMSCIYGEHQFGTEDQGWVAHFLIRAIKGEPITLYGDGMQVRDILFAEDLVNALILAGDNMPRVSGRAFNIGGGPSNAISLLELLDLIAELRGRACNVEMDDWRLADQRFYVSDTRTFERATGWKPSVSVKTGVGRLYRWLRNSAAVNISGTSARNAAGSRAMGPRRIPATQNYGTA